MSKTIKYIGASQRWFELAVTGKQSNWRPGQQEERSDEESAALIATGLFVGVALPVRADSVTGAISTSAGQSVSTAPLTIVGQLGVGQVLTATPSTGWQIAGGQWYADGALISGATTLGYMQLPGDVGKSLSFVPTGLPLKVVAGTVPSGGSAPSLRLVSTNTNWPNNYSTVFKAMMTRRGHKIQRRVTGIALRLVGSYTDPATWTEMVSGAATTVITCLEKNGINLGNFKLAGNTSMVVPDGGQVDTDILPVDLYPGDFVMEREYKTNPNGIMYEGNAVNGNRPGYNDLANGEACYAAASGIVDQSGGVGALTGGTNLTTAMGGAFALIAYHNGVAIGLLEDSIGVGIGETFNGQNGRGISHVSLAALGFPVGKIAQGGDGAVKYLASNTKRRAAMVGIFTDILSNYAFNDIVNFAQTPAQLATSHSTIGGQVVAASMKYHLRTGSPYATSTDGFATTANQTPMAAGAQLNQAWDLFRAGILNVTKVVDTNVPMSTAKNSNVWPATGNAAERRTADNVHPTGFSSADVLASGVFVGFPA